MLKKIRKKTTRKPIKKKGTTFSVNAKTTEVLRDDLFYVDFKFSEPVKNIIEFLVKDLTHQELSGGKILITTLRYQSDIILEFFRDSQEETQQDLYKKLSEHLYEFTRNALNIIRFFTPTKYNFSCFPWFLKAEYCMKANYFEINFNDKLLPFFTSLKENTHSHVFKLDILDREEVEKFLPKS